MLPLHHGGDGHAKPRGAQKIRARGGGKTPHCGVFRGSARGGGGGRLAQESGSYTAQLSAYAFRRGVHRTCAGIPAENKEELLPHSGMLAQQSGAKHLRHLRIRGNSGIPGTSGPWGPGSDTTRPMSTRHALKSGYLHESTVASLCTHGMLGRAREHPSEDGPRSVLANRSRANSTKNLCGADVSSNTPTTMWRGKHST